MPEILFDPQKLKRSLPRRTGCLKLLLILIVLAVACYGGMWVFARYGGEWAMSDQIPIPRESQLLLTDYEVGWVTIKTSFYTHSWPAEALKEWFEQEGIPLLAIYPQLEDQDPKNDFFFMSGTRLTSNQRLHRNSVSFTSNWTRDERSQGTHMCGGLTLFKTEEAFHRSYPDVALPNGMTAFVVRICSPNLE
jgi:hypothetical protein